MVKKIDNVIKDVNVLLEFLEERHVDYVSGEGRAYLDGLRLAGYKFAFVSKDKYDGILEDRNSLLESYNKLLSQHKKNKKTWF